MTSIINKPDQILYAENETPSLGITILLAVTHVALIFDAVVFLSAYFFRFFRHIVTPAVKPHNHTDISHGISNQQPRK